MSSFWQWFIAIGTVGFIVWCVWLIWWSGKQGPSDTADSELVGHKWDGDLEEWNNPAPKWWLYLYLITIAFAVVYLAAYPGLGVYNGFLGWSQEGQYEEEVARAEERYAPIYERFAAMSFDELVASDDAHALGASLYASYCSTCHGSDARGAPGYPNLTDDDWLYGKSEAQIVRTITQGRNAIMPALGAALGGDAGIDNMVTYVQSLSDSSIDGPPASQAMFGALCSACHGMNGQGNQMLGGPNLTDDIWLYGGSREAIRHSIVNGRNGMMPAHGEFLGENRVRILAAYVASLSEPD